MNAGFASGTLDDDGRGPCLVELGLESISSFARCLEYLQGLPGTSALVACADQGTVIDHVKHLSFLLRALEEVQLMPPLASLAEFVLSFFRTSQNLNGATCVRCLDMSLLHEC